MPFSLQETSRCLKVLRIAIVFSILQGCSHLKLEGCGAEEVQILEKVDRSYVSKFFGDSLIGVNEPRIRSSYYRMVLANPSAAATRFFPYALMSSLAYAEEEPCVRQKLENGDQDIKVTEKSRKKFYETLSRMGWEEKPGMPASDAQNLGQGCEDDTGMFYRVWTHQGDSGLDVVLAFRGTWGIKDWFDGNLHWVNRLVSKEDQYNRARAVMEMAIEKYKNEKGVRFYTTGHSLGGGLAQHALYSFPNHVIQAFAFAPSAATGFRDQSVPDQIAGCSCNQNLAAGETRIYRIYDAGEILSNLRLPHKLIFPPERHIQEVRFENNRSHSMVGLTNHLESVMSSPLKLLPNAPATPWYAGIGTDGKGHQCTDLFRQQQINSCASPVSADAPTYSRCPA